MKTTNCNHNDKYYAEHKTTNGFRITIYKVYLKSMLILIYITKIWALTKSNKSKIQVMDMTFLRSTAGIRGKDKSRNGSAGVGV
jgi:hypothetical protein